MEAGRPRYEAVWDLWPPYGPEDLTMGGAEDLFKPSRGLPEPEVRSARGLLRPREGRLRGAGRPRPVHTSN